MEKKENTNKTYKQALFSVEEETTTTKTKKHFVLTEVVPEFNDRKIPIKPKFNNGNFITVFQESLNDIVENGNLTKNELMILISLMGRAEMNGKVVLTHKTICERLKLRKQNVSTAINGLIKRNIILRKCIEQGIKTNGQSNLYEIQINTESDRLNYNLAYKGKIKTFNKVILGEQKITANLKPSIPITPDMFQMAIAEQQEKILLTKP